MIRIRLYREGGRYMESANEKGYTEKGADTWNQPIKKKEKRIQKKEKKRKGKKKTKKEKEKEKEKEKTHVQ
jgi:hypothetical protein